jgi:hypothetical protein
MVENDHLPSASSCEARVADELSQPDARLSRHSVDATGRAIQAGSQYSVAASALHMSHKQQLNLCSLVCLIFLEVCGGPVRSHLPSCSLASLTALSALSAFDRYSELIHDRHSL